MPESLTEPQSKIFNFIRKYSAAHHRSPSVREIASEMGYHSTNAAADAVKALIKKAYLVRDAGARGLRVIYEDDLSTFGLGAAMDRVIAVNLSTIDWTPKGSKLYSRELIYLDKLFVGSGECFAATIADDGMNTVGILKGDIAIIDKRPLSESEKNVLVGIACSEGFLVREYAFANSRIHLSAKSRFYAERQINPNEKFPDAEILGVVRTTFRRLIR
jgi:repressor LexA